MNAEEGTYRTGKQQKYKYSKNTKESAKEINNSFKINTLL